VLTVRFPGSFAQNRDLFEDARAADTRLGDPLLHVAIVHKGLSALEHGDLEAHDRYLEDATRTVERVPEPYFRWTIGFCTSTRRLLSGDLAGAEHMATVALERGLASGQPEALRFYAAQLFEIRRAQGRLGEVLDVLEQTVEDNADFAPFRAGLAAALCDVDRVDDARQVIDVDVSDGFAQYPFDVSWTTSMLLLAEVVHSLSIREPAALLAELLEPWRGWVAYSTLTCHGSLARGLGLALATIDRRKDAVEAFEQALEMNRRLGAPILVARTELDLARTLADTDRSRARALTTSAADTAAELGLGTVARRSRELLAELS
jgi:tetratricopeptide (TPR) repeat protein